MARLPPLLYSMSMYYSVIGISSRSVPAAPCPVIWNCPCLEMTNGCYTCPCHENVTLGVTPVNRGCPPVELVNCAVECIVLDNKGECFVCNCTGVTVISPPKCYNCSPTTKPDQCATIRQCGQNELCHARTTTPHTEKEFQFSCVPKTVCDHLTSAPIVGRRATECDKCCASDLCNKRLCQ